MGSSLPRYILYFIGLIFLQIIFKTYEVVLFNVAFCYVYAMFIMLLPVKIDKIVLMGIGFLLGLTVDIFNNSLGIHAFATVFIAFLRPYIFQFFTPQGGYEVMTVITVQKMGIRWYSIYGFILLFTHHFIVHLIEASNLSFFFHSLGVALISSIYTFGVILLIQYLSTKVRVRK